MKRLISVLVLAFSFAAFAQGSAPAPAGDKPAAEKTEKGEKSEKSDKKAKKAKKAEKEGEKKPETAK
jgi:Ni/Co efflux regulator RcnB